MHDFSPVLQEKDLARALMDSLPSGVMILGDQAQVVTVNKALENILGPNSINKILSKEPRKGVRSWRLI